MSSQEQVDGPIDPHNISSRQLGILAVAEFNMHFQELPEFTPRTPFDRPVLDTQIVSWVIDSAHKDGYLMAWQTRPDVKDSGNYWLNGAFLTVNRCAIQDQQEKAVLDDKRFTLSYQNSVSVGGEHLATVFGDEELLLIQRMASKAFKDRTKPTAALDKYVAFAATFANLNFLRENFPRP